MGTISVSNLGKAYKQYPTRWSRLLEWLMPGHRPRHSLKWILQDINFTVSSGEAVGIIGINGAGKSTLLKIITGTTQPTTGSVSITGRVAALLELGMGFHPDFTGRQNAFMAGQLLGYSVDEIASLMPEIEAFAEIGDYIDQPVRVYSSGMQMRLAFSVATARRPDVLIVDEALSVGDVYFQHKSFDRIREYRKQGTTLLLVSHDKGAIQAICDRAVLLNKGRVALEGEPEEVMDYYNALLADGQQQTVTRQLRNDGIIQTVSGTGEASITDISLLTRGGQRIETAGVGDVVKLFARITCRVDLPFVVFGFAIKDRLGQTVYGTTTKAHEIVIEDIKGSEDLDVTIEFPITLGEGSYSIATAIADDETHLGRNYEWRDYALTFKVINISKPKFIGSSYISLSSLHVERSSDG